MFNIESGLCGKQDMSLEELKVSVMILRKNYECKRRNGLKYGCTGYHLVGQTLGIIH